MGLISGKLEVPTFDENKNTISVNTFYFYEGGYLHIVVEKYNSYFETCQAYEYVNNEKLIAAIYSPALDLYESITLKSSNQLVPLNSPLMAMIKVMLGRGY